MGAGLGRICSKAGSGRREETAVTLSSSAEKGVKVNILTFSPLCTRLNTGN